MMKTYAMQTMVSANATRDCHRGSETMLSTTTASRLNLRHATATSKDDVVGKNKFWGAGMYQPAGLSEFAVVSAASKLTRASNAPHAAILRTRRHNERFSLCSDNVTSSCNQTAPA